MAHEKDHVETCDGLELYCEVFEAENAKAVMIIIPGFGEHCGLYRHAANYLQKSHISVISFDLRGHGQSPGERGDLSSFENCLDDIDLLIARCSDRFKGLPICLMGHNIGAVLAALHTLHFSQHLGALILSRFPDNLEVKPLERFFKPVLKYLAPRPTKFEVTDLLGFKDLDDSKIHRKNLNLLNCIELGEASQYLLDHLYELTSPLYIISRQEGYSFHRKLFEDSLSYSKKLYSEGDRHPSDPKLMEDILPWLLNRIGEFESLGGEAI